MRSATARTVDAETTRRPPRGQEDGVNETSVVTEFRWIEAGGGLPVLCLHGLFRRERPDDLSVSGLRAIPRGGRDYDGLARGA